MCCIDLQPFSIVERAGFQEYVKSLNAKIEFPTAYTVSSTALNDVYNVYQNHVKEILKNSPNHICLVLNMWSDKFQHLSYINLKVHYSEYFEIKVVTLKTEIFQRPHTGLAVSEKIKYALLEFNLQNKNICAVTDGGTNIISALKINNIQRYGCSAHALHRFLTHDFLNNSSFDQINKIIGKLKSIFRALMYSSGEISRLQGLHKQDNLTTILLEAETFTERLNNDENFPTGDDLFHEEIEKDFCSTHHSLKNSVPTRWNSLLVMIESFVKNIDIINIVLLKLNKEELLIPTMEKLIISEFLDFLSIFEKATKYLQGQQYPTISCIIFFYEKMMTSLENAEKESSFKLTIELCNFEKENLRKRIKILKIHVIASLLDPGQKNWEKLSDYLKMIPKFGNADNIYQLQEKPTFYISKEQLLLEQLQKLEINETYPFTREAVLGSTTKKQFLTATAVLTFSFPSEFPPTRTGWQRFTGLFMLMLGMISLMLASGCLTTIVHYKPVEEYVAVPLFHILDDNNFHKLVPAAACMLMLTVTGAFLELFPEMYRIIVRFSTSEWRILMKQIAYESSDSGNPVLAVFIAGSLCAMLSFACPLQNLCHILAASHLSSVFFRAIYLLYSPFRPKFIQQSNPESSLSYSRLSTDPVSHSSSSSRLKRSLWNLSVGKPAANKKPKVKPKNKKEVEKEWLLLGEPTSPCPQREPKDVESTILSDGEPPPSDFEYPDKFDNTESDTSTDIDAIVDEYRQKVKVTTAGPLDRTARIPTVSSWRVTIFAIVVVFLGIALAMAGIFMRWAPAAITGALGVFIISCMMSLIPKYTSSVVIVSPVITCSSIFIGSILFASCAQFSWPAIIFWIIAGLIMLIRCDNLCCSCLNPTSTLTEQLIPSVSAKTTAGTTTTIRMPKPPKGIVSTIPTRVSGHR